MVTPDDFIAMADELISGTSPIKIRTAVCRGYYGAFHAANKFHNELPSPGILQRNGGMHEQLIQRLENPSFKRTDERWMRSKSVGMMLRRVREARTHADYHLDEPLPKEKAQTSLEEAKRIIEKCLL